MCNTPWCFGDCEDCKMNRELEREWEEANAECPHRKECNFVYVNTKTDKCETCGKIFNY